LITCRPGDNVDWQMPNNIPPGDVGGGVVHFIPLVHGQRSDQ